MSIERARRIKHILRSHAANRAIKRQAAGQALLELALSITFISLLLGAAVDLGLAYKSYQTLINATAEATSYLTLRPIGSCDIKMASCDPQVMISVADHEARVRFRAEQGNVLRGTASTLDLDSNGVDDEMDSAHGASLEDRWKWIDARVRIDAADSTQVTPTGTNFAIGNTFVPADPNSDCGQRKKYDSYGSPCYLVIRTQIDYKPFMISPAIGPTLTINAISVIQNTGGTS